MLDFTLAELANLPSRERKAKQYSDKLIKKQENAIEVFGCILTGIAICIFLIVISLI